MVSPINDAEAGAGTAARAPMKAAIATADLPVGIRMSPPWRKTDSKRCQSTVDASKIDAGQSNLSEFNVIQIFLHGVIAPDVSFSDTSLEATEWLPVVAEDRSTSRARTEEDFRHGSENREERSGVDDHSRPARSP
jgi:hypothetical protein